MIFHVKTITVTICYYFLPKLIPLTRFNSFFLFMVYLECSIVVQHLAQFSDSRKISGLIAGLTVGFLVWSLHILIMLAWVYFRYLGFLPQSKHIAHGCELLFLCLSLAVNTSSFAGSQWD